jgi:thiol-disulfide isomerase/thioredoxin
MGGMTKPNRSTPTLRHAVVFALLSLCTAACAPTQLHPLVGKAAPEIVAAPVGGEGPTRLQAALGKVVILDFWATWCVPCKKSLPVYQAIVDQFPGDVAVIAVSVDEPIGVKRSQLVAFAKENHANYAIAWDRDGSDQTKYGGPLRLPTAFVLDRAGTVRQVHSGYASAYGALIADEVKALLKAGK